jgi:thiamine-monophosphate kinase
MDEFEIIKKYFVSKKIRADVMLGIGDDCAIVEIPAEKQLAITTDTLVSGVHFPIDTLAYDIAYKALAVNLSDLAAMGATPAWVTLALTLPNAETAWLEEFCRGFFDLAEKYNVQLIGGDLTRGPLTITVQAHGFVPKNQAITRCNARAGDLIFVTNTLGDAGLALQFLNKKISVPEKFQPQILKRLNRPEPQVEIGLKLSGLATSAIDISDGLAADLKHILEQSEVGAILYVDELPLSAAFQTLSQKDALALALNAGDDYELCFTVAKENVDTLKNTLANFNISCIGAITADQGLNLQFKNGNKYDEKTQGYQHF